MSEYEITQGIQKRQREILPIIRKAINDFGNDSPNHHQYFREYTELRDAMDNFTNILIINNAPILNIYSVSGRSDYIFRETNIALLLPAVQTVFPDITTIQYSYFKGQHHEMFLLAATPEELAQLAAEKEQARLEAEEEERREKKREIEVALQRSRIPQNLLEEYNFKDFKVTDIDKNHSNKEAYRLARQFAGADSDNENSQDGWHNFLTYLGTPGSGKTRLALTVGIYLIKQGDQTFVRYWQVQDLFEVLKGTFNKSQHRHNSHDGNDDIVDDSYNKIIESLKECETLILDDLGAENGTEWVRSILDMIINHRYAHEMNTIVTSNAIDVSELPPRIASRLSEGNICKILMPDFRKVKALQRENKNRKVTK